MRLVDLGVDAGMKGASSELVHKGLQSLQAAEDDSWVYVVRSAISNSHTGALSSATLAERCRQLLTALADVTKALVDVP